MEYTALRQLSAVKDWLGETKIERDAAGAPIGITDHKGRTLAYEWGSLGERRSITYPDGRKALYQYDELLRLQKMQIEKNTEDSTYLIGAGRAAGRFEEINYKYDEMGRISEKLFPEGIRTKWLYDAGGQLKELVHEDDRGVLDRYQYEYDLMGNKTAITKERRGLKEESGRYEYGYDSLSRIAEVSKDGNAIRAYAYDSFGNRSCLEDLEKGRNTSYHYDALNRLMFKEEGKARTEYGYDGRGNLIREELEEKLLHGYEYGAMNRLSKSWNDRGEESLYLYNGLGQRMGRSINGREEDYLLDLTKPYHNLMGIYKNEECSQRFYFDGTAAAMEEASKGKKPLGRTAFSGLHYYLQDELGSPLRVSGFRAKESAVAGRNYYLTYGYDEFGNDLGKELEEAGIPNPYDGQGIEQPFGYTGYRYDEGSGTYFAQAREYLAGNGRFGAEDVIKGNNAVLATLNRYDYCWNKPIDLVDKNGREPDYTAIGESIGNAITSLGETIGNAAGEVGEAIGNATEEIYSTVGNMVQDACGTVGSMTQEIGEIMGNSPTSQLSGELINFTGNYVGNEIRTFGVKVGNFIKDVGTYVESDIKCTTSIYGAAAKKVINNNSIKGVVTLGVAGSIGSGGKLAGSVQMASDTRGNTQFQATGGAGVCIGEGVSGMVVVSYYPRLENVRETEGFSTVIGISGGLGWFGSIDLLFSGEGNDIHPVGISVALGGGEGLEGHAYMTETFGTPVFNIYDIFGANNYMESQESMPQAMCEEN